MNKKELKKKVFAMSLEEKALQMTQYPAGALDERAQAVVTGLYDSGKIAREDLWRVGTVLNAPDGEAVQNIRNARKEKGIDDPLPFMLDVIHGYRTIFPIPLALSCSFDMQLVEDCARFAATEAKYDGVDVTFSPMVDLGRDARWGRVMEGAGEDPYYAGEVGKAFIRGYHAGGIACCVKHFAGYGAAEAGSEYNTTDISERNLREYYLRAYRECVKEQPEMFMSSFNLLNGKPILGHKNIMIDMLRKEWGFDGVVITDSSALEEMQPHGYCATGKDCARVAIESKLDIEMCSPILASTLPELVREGVVSEDLMNDSVMRILELKNKLGMYENPDRHIDFIKREEVTLSGEGRDLARKAIEESCVLLKNDGILPLKESAKIALVGPFADEHEIIGNWAGRGRIEESITVKEGVEHLLERNVTCARGCSWKLFDEDESGFKEALSIAKQSDFIVACVGEHMINSGEAHSRADIRIPEIQRKFISALHELNKPIVLVVFGGRPLVLSEVEKYADAILYVWQPGTEGGNAIAKLLYGIAVPSGKTTMSFPRSVGQCPIYYNHFPTGRPKKQDMPSDLSGEQWRTGYDDEYNSPLYPFGYGLSYTKFEYTDLKLSAHKMKRGEKLIASVVVKNIGEIDGKETVQWYLHDCFASVVRPVKELKGYEKIVLEAGRQCVVQFEIDEELLKFYTDGGDYAAETGIFELYVGGNSCDCLKIEFELLD
ncbi:MAG: glycoside hydrolase family 3 C-terminal domain-containing protein [Lachnospiraceae bacterium]|nr:glycoside hydrolase family 3 C-terminal domain-containing protein [Lachnospiraceae bacterium]